MSECNERNPWFTSTYKTHPEGVRGEFRQQHLGRAGEFLAAASRQERGAKIARLASGKNRFGRNDNLDAAARVPPVPACIVKSYSRFRKRSVPLLGTYVKVPRPDTQHHPEFVLKQSILRPPDCENSADLNIGTQPILDRLFRLFPVGRVRFATCRIAKNGPFAWHVSGGLLRMYRRSVQPADYAGRRTRLSGFDFLSTFGVVVGATPPASEESGAGELFAALALSSSSFLSCCASRCLSP